MSSSIIIYYVLIAFFISLIGGPIVLPILHRLKFGQNIREEGPKSHQKKSGTPTMGGIIFISATIITMVIIISTSSRNYSDESMVALYAMCGFGFIGLLDDSLKIIKKNNLGLRAYQKMILLLVLSLAFAIYGKNNMGTKIIIPFTGNIIDLGIWYIPFIVFYFACTTNAVNLTDGLDGLATTITILVMTFFALVSYAMWHYHLALFSAVLCGALLGFLRYNSYKASVFMGDTGSLALGGAVAAVAMILKLPLLIIIVGGIYVVETLSVIIQVISFKLTGKRVFKMAPIHHHFELLGWHETKVVSVFSIITVILCLLAFVSFK